MNLTHAKQDLLKVESDYVICHCISVDCAMGAGVVVPIKEKYTGVKPACQTYAAANKSTALGSAFRYKTSRGTVYNLFTKELVFQHAGVKLSYADYMRNLRNALADMKA